MSETDSLAAPSLAPPSLAPMCPGFDDPQLLEWLRAAGDDALDAAPFGIIGLDAQGVVTFYNAFESRAAGLRPERVLGRPFFDEVALCMNNFLVAQRFADAATLDETLPYTLTLRMRPTPVRLRLLQRPGAPRAYVLVAR